MLSRRRPGGRARATVLAAVIAVGLAGAPAAAADTSATCRGADKGTVVQALRYAGANRYDTAVCASLSTWASAGDPDVKPEFLAGAVVLARGDAFPDALAGGPFATHVNAPLLLTSPTALLPTVQAEIQRVLPTGGTVYLLGGTGSLSAGVEAKLTSLGYAPTRLAGANRFETAIRIAEAMPATSDFFITTGMDFPDALAAGSTAAYLNRGTGTSVLLFTNNTAMPAVTRDFAVARRAQFGRWNLVTAGGAADRAAVTAFGATSLAERFVGRNRFETATLLARKYYVEGGSLVGAGAAIANGMDFPDALAATSTLAIYGEPLLLAQTGALSAETRQFLDDHAGTTATTPAVLDLFGGTGVLSDAVKNAAVAAFTP